MSHYERTIAKLTEMNPTHVETLMLSQYRTLDALPVAAFERFARIAESMGADRLRKFHEAETN